MSLSTASATTPSPGPTCMQNMSVGQAPIVLSTQDLWGKAMDMLSDEDKQNINSDRKDKLAILRDLLTVVNKKRRVCMEKRWKYKKGNQKAIIRDQLEKVVVWVDKFKEFGDAAVQYDTGYVLRLLPCQAHRAGIVYIVARSHLVRRSSDLLSNESICPPSQPASHDLLRDNI